MSRRRFLVDAASLAISPWLPQGAETTSKTRLILLGTGGGPRSDSEMAGVACVGCGAIFEDVDGPTHRYMESSPGCWAVYGDVLAREYGDVSYASLHRLTVDAYAVQHPGSPSPQSTQSVALHLMSLCLVLERGLEPSRTTAFLRTAVEPKGQFVWLAPPASRGAITVKDVQRAGNAAEHRELVRIWADSVWSSWSRHHATIHAWLLAREPRVGG